ncbi:hypothetical protein Tco_1012191 [Tanacetum coccineum]
MKSKRKLIPKCVGTGDSRSVGITGTYEIATSDISRAVYVVGESTSEPESTGSCTIALRLRPLLSNVVVVDISSLGNAISGCNLAENAYHELKKEIKTMENKSATLSRFTAQRMTRTFSQLENCSLVGGVLLNAKQPYIMYEACCFSGTLGSKPLFIHPEKDTNMDELRVRIDLF